MKKSFNMFKNFVPAAYSTLIHLICLLCENFWTQTIPFTSLFDPCENRIGPCEIRFDHCENKIGPCENRIDHCIIETVSCILVLIYHCEELLASAHLTLQRPGEHWCPLSKNFLWASRLWVGRRKEPILGYVPKNDEKIIWSIKGWR